MVFAMLMLLQGHEVLTQLVGDWRTMQRVVTADPAVETEGEAYGRLSHKGNFLFLETRGMSQGAPAHVTTIFGFDDYKNEFQAVAVGDHVTPMYTSTGSYDPERRELVLRGRMDDRWGNREVRYVFRFETEDRFVFEVYDTDDSGREFLVVESTHTRAEHPRVRGVGGVFFKADDPEKLRAWYREHLGIAPRTESAFGNSVVFEGFGYTVWGPFSRDTTYFEPSDKPFMFNYRVDDLDAMLDRLREAGVSVDEKVEEYPYGRFGWFMDLEGNRVELWEPPVDHR